MQCAALILKGENCQMLHYRLQLNAAKSSYCKLHPQPTPTPTITPNQSLTMSFDTGELIKKHFNALEEEEVGFTSDQSKTQLQLPRQLEEQEARELEEALKLLAQEALERHKKKGKNPHKPSHEVGEPSTASVMPKKRKASFETIELSPSLERNITIMTHSPLGQEWVE